MADSTNNLLDVRASDGSRHFAALPESIEWMELRGALTSKSGVIVTKFVSDRITQAIIDFTYRGHEFTVDTQFGEYWLFVRDAACPVEILTDVVKSISLMMLNTKH